MESLPGHLERLPSGGDAERAQMLVCTQRERILVAFYELVAKRGYRATTIELVVKRAGVSRVTYYENFENREDCLRAVFEICTGEIAERIASAGDGRELPWPEQAAAGIASILDYVAENPALSRTCFVEAMTAGPAAVTHYEQVLRGFARYLETGRKFAEPGIVFPENLEDTIVGGVVWMIHQRLLHGEADRIPELLPTMVEFALAPYLGERAAAEVAAKG
jgi:AcrR family transcriptional regulator